MAVNRFEDLRAWQQARILMTKIYALCGQGHLANDFGLRNQLQRAAISVMANIAEGFDCESKTEFVRFLGYARRSTIEIQSLLYISLDTGYISVELFESHKEQAEKTKAFIAALMKGVKKRS